MKVAALQFRIKSQFSNDFRYRGDQRNLAYILYIEFIVPKPMRDPIVAISPMASGRLESSAKALLDTFLTKRHTGGDEEEGEVVSLPSPVLTRRSPSSETGGAAPKSTIFFFFGFSFCFVLPWLHRIRMVRRRWRFPELHRLWREGDLRGEVNGVLRGFRAGDMGEMRWGGGGRGDHFGGLAGREKTKGFRCG